MRPILFSIFGIPVHSYPTMIALGFLLGLLLVRRVAKQSGLDPRTMTDLCFWLLAGGLIGSKIAFILVNFDDYWDPCFNLEDWNATHPAQALPEADCTRFFTFWRGGLVFYGAVFGALAVLVWFIRSEKQSVARFADALMPSLALGQAFGRIGCFLAGCCYGQPSDVPWAVHFGRGTLAHVDHVKNHLLPISSSESLAIHPVQLYDSVFGFLLCAVLLWIHHRAQKKHIRPGHTFLWWCCLYPLSRSFVELFRGDTERGYLFHVSWPALNKWLALPENADTFLSTSQTLSLIVFFVAAGILVARRLLKKDPEIIQDSSSH